MAKKNALRTLDLSKIQLSGIIADMEAETPPSAEKFFEDTQAAETFGEPLSEPPTAITIDPDAPSLNLQVDPTAPSLQLSTPPGTYPSLFSGVPAFDAAIRELQESRPAPVPTVTSITCVLGRVAVVGENVTVAPHKVVNNTRWIFDVDLEGSTAVELDLQLLGFNTGRPVDASIVSFTLGALNGNFYPARPHLVQEGGKLTLKTVALPKSAKVRFRVSLDTYHSAHR